MRITLEPLDEHRTQVVIRNRGLACGMALMEAFADGDTIEPGAIFDRLWKGESVTVEVSVAEDDDCVDPR